MKMFMGYDKNIGSSEGACLIFANSIREAKRLAFPVIQFWFDSEWIDIRVRTLADHEYLRSEQKSEFPHVVESPISCSECGLWITGEIKNGVCPDCYNLTFIEREKYEMYTL